MCPHHCPRDPNIPDKPASYDVWPTFKRHFVNKHTGGPGGVKCTVPGCGKVLSRADAIRKHMRLQHPKVTLPFRGQPMQEDDKENEEPAPVQERVDQGPSGEARGDAESACCESQSDVEMAEAAPSMASTNCTEKKEEEDEPMEVDESQPNTTAEDVEEMYA